MKRTLLAIVLLFITIISFADTSVRIELGDKDSQISYVNEGNTIWYPVFFSADKKGNIYIPDFYKGRIAVFSGKGKFLKSIITDYISPRMNVFIRSSEGKFIVIDSGNLYVISDNGSLEWSYKFPPGFIPDAVYAIEKYIYVLSPAGDLKTPGKAAYAFESSKNKPIGLLGSEIDGKIIPTIIASEKLVVSDTLAHSQLINEKDVSKGADEIIFLSRDGNNNSWWYNKKNAAVYKNLIIIPKFIPTASIMKNHMWLCISDNGDIYYSRKADADEKVIEIYKAE